VIPPLVSFVTWNRMGLSIRNLKSLLSTSDDFELHIVDSNSRDNTWDYIKVLKDERIKSRTRFEANRGPVYAANFNLARRKKGQYFVTVDSDVNIHTKKWLSEFLKAFECFPEVGLLGAVSCRYYERYKHPLIKVEKNGAYYLQMHKGFIEGCCQCFRPELLDILGYWSEENCMGDVEICHRICNYTTYKAGFFPAVEIDQTQKIACSGCRGEKLCNLDKEENTCFSIWEEFYSNPKFRAVYGWKYKKCVEEMADGKRTVYCASIHDEDSMKNHYYRMNMAQENFQYYEMYSN